MGKGDNYRPVEHFKYAKNYLKIYGVKCFDCNGTGHCITGVCKTCDGMGYVEKARKDKPVDILFPTFKEIKNE